MKGGYKIIDFKHIPLSDAEHPVLVPDLRTVLDENYGKAVLLTNVVLGVDSMDDCFSTVVLKSNGRIKLNSYDGYITVDSDSYAHYTEGSSGDPTAEIEEIKEDIQDIQSDIGDLNDLSTEEKTSLVGSVNEVNGKVDDVSDDLGNLSDLNTTDKSSAVAAINEVNTKVSKTEVLISNSGDAYDPTRPYNVGEYCIHDDKLYRCTTACSAGSWETNQSCFTQNTLVNAVDNVTKIVTGQITPSNGITYAHSYIKKRNGLVNISINTDNNGNTLSISGWGYATIATIPSDFAPKTTLHAILSVADKTSGVFMLAAIEINPNGDIVLRNIASGNSIIPRTFYCNLSYLL